MVGVLNGDWPLTLATYKCFMIILHCLSWLTSTLSLSVKSQTELNIQTGNDRCLLNVLPVLRLYPTFHFVMPCSQSVHLVNKVIADAAGNVFSVFIHSLPIKKEKWLRNGFLLHKTLPEDVNVLKWKSIVVTAGICVVNRDVNCISCIVSVCDELNISKFTGCLRGCSIP